MNEPRGASTNRSAKYLSRARGKRRTPALICVVLLVARAHTVHAGINAWTSHGPATAAIGALAIDPRTPSTLYAGAQLGGGVFKSTDTGSTWSAMNTGLPANSSVSALAIDPRTPTTLYAGAGAGLFTSADGGSTWSEVNTGLPDSDLYGGVYALAIDPRTPTTLYAGTGTSVIKSTDGGAIWSAINFGTAVLQLAIDPHTPTTLYAILPLGCFHGLLCSAAGVFKSTDAGGTWAASDPLAPVILIRNFGLAGASALAIDPLTPGTLYAGTGRGVFRSTDAAGTWTAENTGFTTIGLIGVFALAIDPRTPRTLYAGTDTGVFESADGGTTWYLSNFPGVPVFDPRTPRTLYAMTNGGVFKSTDGGGTWSEMNTGLPAPFSASALVIDPSDHNTLYAVAGSVFKSTDGGGTWSAANTGLTDTVQVFAIDPQTPTTLYAGTMHSGVFKSRDAGGTWTATNTGLHYKGVLSLAIDPFMPTTLYVATEARGGVDVRKSTDGGISWDPSNFPGVPVFDPSTPGTLYLKGGVSKSTDGGANWSTLNMGLPGGTNVFALAIDPLMPTTVYAGTETGVFDIEQVPAPETATASPSPTSTPMPSLTQAPTQTDTAPPTSSATATSPTPLSTVVQTATTCVGDCDGNRKVGIDELISLVNIDLGNPGSCSDGVPAGARVDVSLLVVAVNQALDGCGGPTAIPPPS